MMYVLIYFIYRHTLWYEKFSEVADIFLNTITRYMSLLKIPNDKQTFAIKVSEFQKQIFLFSFEPKTKRNYFLISVPTDLKWVK